MSTPIAAMANYTVIGSCQPVEITVEGTKYITESKIINALVSWIKTRAEMYGRNQTIAEKFITENLDLNATLAERYGVVELVSPSIDELLQDINGTPVHTSKRTVILDTEGVKQIFYSPSLKIQIMRFFANPILTSLLLASLYHLLLLNNGIEESVLLFLPSLDKHFAKDDWHR